MLFNLYVLSFPDTGFLRGAGVAQHIAYFVPRGPCPVGASEILTRYQRPDVVLLTADEAAPLDRKSVV